MPRFIKVLLARFFAFIPIKHKFRIIHKLNLFGKSTSKSGPGSSLEATFEVRKHLPTLIQRYNIKSVLDIPCGDALWISTLFTDIIEYTGADIVPTLLSKNRVRYPGINFIQLDATVDVPDKVDLILCRDLLVHLNLEHAKRVFNNFKSSKSTYLLVTNFPNTSTNLELSGIWRPLNIQLEPFNQSHFLERLNENCQEAGGAFKDKELVLLKIN